MKYLTTLPTIFTLMLILSFSSFSFAQEIKAPSKTINKVTIEPEKPASQNKQSESLKTPEVKPWRPDGTRSQVPDPTVGLAKATGSLAIILAVIFAIYYALKKFSKQIGIQSKDNPIRVHSKQMLDSKTSLYLIRVYEDEFLISVGSNGISNIARYALIGEDGKQENIPNAPEFRQFMGETVGEDIKPAGLNENV